MTDYDDLRAKALAATPGPWKWGWRNDDVTPGSVHTDEPNCRAIAMCPRYGKREFKRDAAYIAAANPATVLALLDEIDALRADAERYRHMRDKEIVLIRCLVERRGYRQTTTDAPWEKWDEHIGWTTSDQPMIAEAMPTMDAAIDRARGSDRRTLACNACEAVVRSIPVPGGKET